MKRFLTIAALIGCLGLIITGIVVRSCLRSRQVAQHVTTRLEALYGGPVRVGEVDVGLSSTSLTNFALYEEGSEGADDTPWFKVASLTADVSLWDLLSGNAVPKRVTLRGATLVFRFDRDGNLLTRFPGHPTSAAGETLSREAVPEADLENGEVIFRKEGSADLIVKNINVRFTNNDGRLILSGTGASAEMGQLVLKGFLEKDANEATVHLKNEGKAHLTSAILDRIPFVPDAVWQEIPGLEGDTTAALWMSYDLAHDSLRYRVDLAPENTQLFVPAIDLKAHHVSGTVVIRDNQVHLRQLKGRVFSGQLSTDADLDFRRTVNKLQFTRIKADSLNLSELPEEWNIPEVIRSSTLKGKLSGEASLLVTIAPGRLTPADACALVTLPSVSLDFGAGQWLCPTSLLAVSPRPVVQTQGHGRGQVRDPDSKSAPIEFDWHVTPR